MLKDNYFTIHYVPKKPMTEYDSFALVKTLLTAVEGIMVDWGHDNMVGKDYLTVKDSPYTVGEAASIVADAMHQFGDCK